MLKKESDNLELKEFLKKFEGLDPGKKVSFKIGTVEMLVPNIKVSFDDKEVNFEIVGAENE